MSDNPIIPGYKIERELGRGGMATVYLAHEEKLERLVALKVLEILSAQGRDLAERFIREAKTAAKLQHSNIVSIFDVGSAGNLYYMAVEYLRGGTLREKLRSGPMEPAQALRIAAQMAEALGYAHRQGFIHRDIKPDNIMFRNEGQAVLTDFGIARAVDSTTKLTRTGMSIGTPHYMSPEQARGQAVNSRSDLYSLGIVLYEMLTGKVPFDGEDSVAVAIKHVQEPVPALPAALAQFQPLLNSLLAKDPKKRVQTGKDLVTMIQDFSGLERFFEGPAVKALERTPALRSHAAKKSAARVSQAERKAVPGSTRKGRELVFSLFALLSMLVIALFLFLVTGKKPISKGVAETKQPIIHVPPASATKGTVVDTKEQEYRQYFEQAKKSFESGEYTKALSLIAKAKLINPDPAAIELEKLIITEINRLKREQLAADEARSLLEQLTEEMRRKAEAERATQLAEQKKLEAEAERAKQETGAKNTTVATPRAEPIFKLRSEYWNLFREDAQAMVRRFNYFEKNWNRPGKGIKHQYEPMTVSGDRVVIDHATGLMWHYSGSENTMEGNSAASAVRRNYAGHADWRLPTLEEAASLLESSKLNGDLYISPIFSNVQRRIWTGDGPDQNNTGYWVVDFSDGDIDALYHFMRRAYIRPVRSIK